MIKIHPVRQSFLGLSYYKKKKLWIRNRLPVMTGIRARIRNSVWLDEGWAKVTPYTKMIENKQMRPTTKMCLH